MAAAKTASTKGKIIKRDKTRNECSAHANEKVKSEKKGKKDWAERGK